MDVLPLTDRAAHAGPVLAQAGPLVRTLGTSEFEVRLFEVMNSLTACDHISIFMVPSGGTPRVLLAASKDGTSIATKIGHEYASRFWHLDPANRIDLRRASDKCGVLVRSTPADLGAADYRRQCYDQTDWIRTGSKIIERLSLLVIDSQSVVKISLFRQSATGPFDDCDIQATAACAEFLAALLTKHDQLISANRGGFDNYLNMLAIVAPSLSPREREVCAGIACGMTSEAIRLKLGLSLGTIQTHRKRAYARLRISSQNELLKLLFSGAKPAAS